MKKIIALLLVICVVLSFAACGKDNTPAEEKKECVVDISIDAHIPESYIDSVKNRIGMYKRIAEIQTGEDAMDVMDEFIDRFGEPPVSIKGLIDVALLRANAANLGIYEIKQQNGMILAFVNDLKPEAAAVAAISIATFSLVENSK